MTRNNKDKNQSADQKRTVVCITGATGVMGSATVNEFLKHSDEFSLRLLVRDSKKNRNKALKWLEYPNTEIIYGDLTIEEDVAKAIGDAEYVLHIGGMVSPLADHYPELTMKVNTKAARNVVEAIKKRPDNENVKLVYIGSVAQTAHRHEPHHWGRTGDPIMGALYDTYAISKIKAELTVAESGLSHWVSLRQSGILHKGLIFKGSDPISFHVPLRGVLEWATVEDSARLMVGVCREGVPETFWNKFYNIGSGQNFRLTNYEFEKLLLRSLGCPPPEKCFDTNWFATRNFHGEWYEDSDKLNEMIPFREGMTAEAYFSMMARKMPWWIKLTPLAPSFAIKQGMKSVARFKKLGTLNWLAGKDDEERIKAFFGSREKQTDIAPWDKFDLSRPSELPVLLCHGYDETKPLEEIELTDVTKAAGYRNLICLSKSMTKGDLYSPLEFECGCGHRFAMRPATLLLGGHWCPECECNPSGYKEEARKNAFLAQVWYDSHPEDK